MQSIAEYPKPSRSGGPKVLMRAKKDKARIKRNAEVYTPDKLVNQMLNKLPKSCWMRQKTFCDPAIGEGAFAIWILIRKLSKGHKSLDALKTLYGVDIMQDSVRICRMRLLKVVALFGDEITEDHIRAVLQNIVWVNPTKFPGGSLEYNFEFDCKPRRETVENWLRWVNDENALDHVELPVPEEIFDPQGQVMIDWEE